MSDELNALDEAQTTAEENQPIGGSQEQPKEKLYTDAYVKARIDKQNVKHAGELAERDERIAELEKKANEANEVAEKLRHEKELSEWAAKASAETGIPASVIRGNTEEEMLEHANAIKSSVGLYPSIQDSGAPAAGKLTKAQIMSITDESERRAAIKENIELFA